MVLNGVYQQLLKRIILYFTLIGIGVSSCTAYHPGITRSELKRSVETSDVFSQNFTGFALYDIKKQKMVYEQNASKYFTPASNVKLLTFYAGLKILGDSVPAFKYTVCNDSLIFRGTGDPTFLHPSFKESNVYSFLRNRKEKLFYSTQKYSGESLGPGWSWDWYKYSYSTEKAAFPIYGNLVRFNLKHDEELPNVEPVYFARFLQKKTDPNIAPEPIIRDMSDNLFTYNADSEQSKKRMDIPFKYSPDLLVDLLSDTLHANVGLIGKKSCKYTHTLYSVPCDSIYRKMLQESDNFIAEQLLLLCSSEILDSLNSDLAISYIKDRFLNDIPDKPVWVDGSGLSRYNLLTPRILVEVLKRIFQEVPQERLFKLLAAGGESGTIKDFYKGQDGPYIFAKSGTLSNNHCLSGYLLTKSGRTLIFSFMHNNHVMPSNTLKREMEKVLWAIHERY